MQIVYSTNFVGVFVPLTNLHNYFLWPLHFLAKCMASFLLMRPDDRQNQTGDTLACPLAGFHSTLPLSFLFSVNKPFSQWCRGSCFICVIECCIMMILNVACWSVFMQRSRTQEKACQFRPRPKTSIIQWQEWWNLHYSRPLASSLQPDLQNWDENVKRKVLEEGVNNWAT